MLVLWKDDLFLVEKLPCLRHAQLNETPRLRQVVIGLQLEEARTQCSAVLDLYQDIQRLAIERDRHRGVLS